MTYVRHQRKNIVEAKSPVIFLPAFTMLVKLVGVLNQAEIMYEKPLYDGPCGALPIGAHVVI